MPPLSLAAVSRLAAALCKLRAQQVCGVSHWLFPPLEVVALLGDVGVTSRCARAGSTWVVICSGVGFKFKPQKFNISVFRGLGLGAGIWAQVPGPTAHRLPFRLKN